VEKKELVERDNEAIAVARQCELLGLSRSSYYYSSTRDDEYNLELMQLLDEQYTKVPFYGVRRLTAWLRAQGYIVNPKRVRVLMRRMGLQAIFPHKRRSFSLPGFNKKGYFFFFNNAERLHQGLGYRTPYEVYFGHTASKNFVELGNLNG
jgi:putative transposase